MNFLNLAPWQWGLIGIAAVLIVAINYGQSILAWLTTPRATVPGTTATVKPGVPTRRQVLDYADAIYTYFEGEKCKEGMAAIETVVKHAFHEHDTEGNPTTAGAK